MGMAQPDALAQTAQMILMALLEERERSEGAQQMDLIDALTAGYEGQPWVGGGMEGMDQQFGGLHAGPMGQPWASDGEDPDWMGMMSSLAGLFKGGGGM
jgi:hypothetical protein